MWNKQSTQNTCVCPLCFLRFHYDVWFITFLHSMLKWFIRWLKATQAQRFNAPELLLFACNFWCFCHSFTHQQFMLSFRYIIFLVLVQLLIEFSEWIHLDVIRFFNAMWQLIQEKRWTHFAKSHSTDSVENDSDSRVPW